MNNYAPPINTYPLSPNSLYNFIFEIHTHTCLYEHFSIEKTVLNKRLSTCLLREKISHINNSTVFLGHRLAQSVKYGATDCTGKLIKTCTLSSLRQGGLNDRK